MSRRRFSKKKKLEILEEAKTEKPADVAAKYDLPVQYIYMWRMKYKNHEKVQKNDAFIKSNKLQELESENDKLKKLCIALAFDNASLKEMLDKKSNNQNTLSP